MRLPWKKKRDDAVPEGDARLRNGSVDPEPDGISPLPAMPGSRQVPGGRSGRAERRDHLADRNGRGRVAGHATRSALEAERDGRSPIGVLDQVSSEIRRLHPEASTPSDVMALQAIAVQLAADLALVLTESQQTAQRIDAITRRVDRLKG